VIAMIGGGVALGARRQSNTPEQIEKTGIVYRHYVDEGQTIRTLAAEAARSALASAGIGAGEIGLIIACTTTHDHAFPALAAAIHHDLSCSRGQFFDLNAACSSFITAAIAARSMIAVPVEPRRAALVVGAEVFSPFVRPGDEEVEMFLSDGAGAIVLVPGRPYGLLSWAAETDTSNLESVRLAHGSQIEMHGLATFKQAVAHLPETVHRAVDAAGWTMDDVDLIVFHQANLRLIEFLMSRLRLPTDRTFTNVAELGNTGAASIPIALTRGWDRLRGNVVIAGIGAGFGFMASCWRFPQ
jgi:3-oxoacyl-[acyl-carrier-protein] synthase-3